MTTLNELIGEFTADELQVYFNIGIPLDHIGVLSPEEERELEEMDREDHEQWLEEQRTHSEPDSQKGFWADEDWWVDDDGVLRAPWESDDED